MMQGIDKNYDADQSAVLRYFPGLFPQSMKPHVVECSIREGFRVVQLEPYHDVALSVLDETTCMHTGTYKSLDGCVTTAMAREKGYSSIVCSSGANAGRALTEYGARVGMETFFFCPESTLFKLSREIFHKSSSHLISVEGSDRRVKDAAKAFSELTGVALVPELDWRLAASSVRGMFIAEQVVLRNERFDWFAQAVCAGFGPIGIYKALQNMLAQGLLDSSAVPLFLGVQQAALSPIADAWSRRDENLKHSAQWKMDSVIEPSLYNTLPAPTYPMLRNVLTSAGGDVIAVEHGEFALLAQEYLRRVEDSGIHLTRRDNGEVLEKAGLLAGAGVLKAIHDGRIRPGHHVLCSLSGGASTAVTTPAEPQFHIPMAADLSTVLMDFIREHGNAHSFESIRR